jgi:hypothetical protein
MHASGLVKEAEVRVRKKATMVPRVCRNPAAGATMAYEAVRCSCPMSVMLPLSRGLGWPFTR